MKIEQYVYELIICSHIEQLIPHAQGQMLLFLFPFSLFTVMKVIHVQCLLNYRLILYWHALKIWSLHQWGNLIFTPQWFQTITSQRISLLMHEKLSIQHLPFFFCPKCWKCQSLRMVICPNNWKTLATKSMHPVRVLLVQLKIQLCKKGILSKSQKCLIKSKKRENEVLWHKSFSNC